MRYPIKSNWITYEVDPNASTDKETFYRVDNFLSPGIDISVSEDVIHFIEKLDGHHDPRRLLKRYSREEVGIILKTLEEYELIRTKKTIISGITYYMRTLVIIKESAKYRGICKILNNILMLSFFPMLGIGLYNLYRIIMQDLSPEQVVTEPLWMTLLYHSICVMIGIALHELSHAISAIAYSARVMEFGVVFQGFPGAYTLIDCRRLKNRLKKVQIYLAGIECNFLLFGLCTILCLFCTKNVFLFYLFLRAAVFNILIALTNLLFVNGLDGMKVISCLLGNENILEDASNMLREIISRRSFRIGQDINDYGRFVSAMLFSVTKLIFPLLIIFELLLWIEV